MVNGTELKAGEYKVEVNGDKATITSGKTSVQAPVRMETSDTKYNATTVRYATGAGNYVLDEIHVGVRRRRSSSIRILPRDSFFV